MKSFTNYKQAIQEAKRKARSTIIKDKDYPFISYRGDSFLVVDDNGRVRDGEPAFYDTTTKKDLIEIVLDVQNDMKENPNDYTGITRVFFDSGYDLKSSIKDSYADYDPWVAYVELEIWNSQDGWLY